MGIDPRYIMIPVTMACSYASMLPIASGTNAIVFETAKMSNLDMVTIFTNSKKFLNFLINLFLKIVPGFWVKMICCATIFGWIHLTGNWIFHFETK